MTFYIFPSFTPIICSFINPEHEKDFKRVNRLIFIEMITRYIFFLHYY